MINASGLGVRLGNFALKDVNLHIGDRECVAIIGPNGSGKTTLLECIAGLQRIRNGKIMIDNMEVTNLPPEKRRIGYVPQDYVLFPHLTVDQNIMFGMRNEGNKRLEESRRIMNWLDIEHLVGRDVRTLSAGERQKVALARALAVKPKAMLLDEPLSALDPLARDKLRRELKIALTEILQTLKMPVIYVTHDLSEAEVMSDKMAVLNQGKIVQIGTMDEVFENPSSEFVAEFLGFNIFNGHVVSASNGIKPGVVEVRGTHIQTEVDMDIAPDEDVSILLKPKDIYLTLDSKIWKPKWQHCRCNIIRGSVVEIHKMGSLARITIDAGIFLRSEVSVDELEELNIEVGSRISAQFRASKIKLIQNNPSPH